jgi:hypothetical protein
VLDPERVRNRKPRSLRNALTGARVWRARRHGKWLIAPCARESFREVVPGLRGRAERRRVFDQLRAVVSESTRYGRVPHGEVADPRARRPQRGLPAVRRGTTLGSDRRSDHLLVPEVPARLKPSDAAQGFTTPARGRSVTTAAHGEASRRLRAADALRRLAARSSPPCSHLPHSPATKLAPPSDAKAFTLPPKGRTLPFGWIKTYPITPAAV